MANKLYSKFHNVHINSLPQLQATKLTAMSNLRIGLNNNNFIAGSSEGIEALEEIDGEDDDG